MQMYNILFNYDKQTGTINYNNISKNRGLTGPSINVNELSNPTMAKDVLGIGVELTISEESTSLLAQMQETKRQKELDTLSEFYANIGEADKAPKTFGDISATDRALLSMKYSSEMDGVTSVFVNQLYERTYDDHTKNYTNLVENAFGVAVQQEYLSGYFSDDAIMRRIGDMNLSDDADKDYVFKAAKSYGEKLINDFNENIANFSGAAKYYSTQEAQYYASFFSGAFSNNIEDIQEPLVKSFENLFKESINTARKLIHDGYNGDIIEKLKEVSFNNSSVRFNINGIELTLKELDDTNKVIANAISKINDYGNNMSYEKLGELHASIYNEAQAELSWLSEEDSGKLLGTMKKEYMDFQLNLKLSGDGTRMLHDAIKSGSLPNNSRINIGEFIRDNKTLQSYTKAYEKAYLEALK